MKREVKSYPNFNTYTSQPLPHHIFANKRKGMYKILYSLLPQQNRFQMNKQVKLYFFCMFLNIKLENNMKRRFCFNEENSLAIY